MGVLVMEHDGVNIGIFEIVLKRFFTLLFVTIVTVVTIVTRYNRYRRYTIQSLQSLHVTDVTRQAAGAMHNAQRTTHNAQCLQLAACGMRKRHAAQN